MPSTGTRVTSKYTSEGDRVAKAIGIGGVFFKSPDMNRLLDWYSEHLGLPRNDEPGVSLYHAALPEGSHSVWAPFKADTRYFDPSEKEFMFNLIVDDLEGALKQVAAAGAQLVGKPEHYDFGSFGWFLDPDGNKVELWQPKP